MGKARIIEHIGAGEYSVDYEFKHDDIDARIAAMNEQITQLQGVTIPALEEQEREILQDLDQVELSNDILIEALNAGDLQNPTVPTVDQSTFLGLINAERSAASVPTVGFNTPLRSAAQIHAGHIANLGAIGTRGPGNLTPSQTAEPFGYINQAQPVLAVSCAGARTMQEAVDTWMLSTFTSAIVLDPAWVDWGFGFQVTDIQYKYYWMCFFGVRN